jgi:hypothetical protein
VYDAGGIRRGTLTNDCHRTTKSSGSVSFCITRVEAKDHALRVSTGMSITDLPGFDDWLEGLLGPHHGRRLAAVSRERIVLSKVPPGLPGSVRDAVERVPALSFPGALQLLAPEGVGGVRAWRAAADRALEDARHAGAIDDAGLAAIRVGIDSVEALLASCCWTDDASPAWAPGPAEREALAEASARLAPGRDSLFTRYYGEFEGRPVEAHCPGAPVARRIFDAAREFLEARVRGAASACPGAGATVP